MKFVEVETSAGLLADPNNLALLVAAGVLCLAILVFWLRSRGADKANSPLGIRLNTCKWQRDTSGSGSLWTCGTCGQSTFSTRANKPPRDCKRHIKDASL